MKSKLDLQQAAALCQYLISSIYLATLAVRAERERETETEPCLLSPTLAAACGFFDILPTTEGLRPGVAAWLTKLPAKRFESQAKPKLISMCSFRQYWVVPAQAVNKGHGLRLAHSCCSDISYVASKHCRHAKHLIASWARLKAAATNIFLKPELLIASKKRERAEASEDLGNKKPLQA